MGLMQPYLGKHQYVFVDNYFTSVHLAEALLRENTYLCSSTRSNRKEYPKAIAKQHLRQGKSVKWTNGTALCSSSGMTSVTSASLPQRMIGGKEVRQKNQLIEASVPHCVQGYDASRRTLAIIENEE